MLLWAKESDQANQSLKYLDYYFIIYIYIFLSIIAAVVVSFATIIINIIFKISPFEIGDLYFTNQMYTIHISGILYEDK